VGVNIEVVFPGRSRNRAKRVDPKLSTWYSPAWHLSSFCVDHNLRNLEEIMGLKPLISVCIPCYNGRKFIAITLESVLRQTLGDFEVVVLDDKSSDETVSIIRTFSDSRIRLIQNDSNLGMGRNWNKALSCAHGKYVKLLCQDDILSPECLARQAEVLENHSNSRVVLTICNRLVIDERGETVLRRRFPFGPGVVRGEKLIRRSIRCGSNLIGEPVVGLFRRGVLARTKMCDTSNPYLSDLSLWSELLKHGDAFIDQDYLASFRLAEGAATASIGLRQAAYFRQFVRAVRSEAFYRVNLVDASLAYLLSFQWCVLRNIYSKLLC
jgi:glycosyltransferase involved in cell wall biosynthesis